MEKRRNCSWGAISPLFHNIFNIYFYLKESNYIVICKNWLFKLFFLNTTNLICRNADISNCFKGPFDFEISRVDCIPHMYTMTHEFRNRTYKSWRMRLLAILSLMSHGFTNHTRIPLHMSAVLMYISQKLRVQLSYIYLMK